MSARFEDRHRELRDLDNPYLGTTAHPDCLAFEVRTGPLVDDLVAAVRELRDAPRDGTVDIAALHRRMEAALAALDEEAAR